MFCGKKGIVGGPYPRSKVILRQFQRTMLAGFAGSRQKSSYQECYQVTRFPSSALCCLLVGREFKHGHPY